MRYGKEMESEAVVLKAWTAGENDLLVDFLTPDFGRLHGIARHGRKSQKRFGTVLESMNWVRLRGRDAGGLVSLEESSLLKPWRRIDAFLPLLTAGFHVIELIRQLVPERNPDARVFRLLTECLEALDETAPGEIATPLARFEYRLLDVSGFGPNLKECLSCGRPRVPGENFFFVYHAGGIFCAPCLPPSASGGFDPLTKAGLPKILSQFLEYQLGHSLKTRKFLTDKAFYG
jgi:DNA repair protein RecO (recombination protein O)